MTVIIKSECFPLLKIELEKTPLEPLPHTEALIKAISCLIFSHFCDLQGSIEKQNPDLFIPIPLYYKKLQDIIKHYLPVIPKLNASHFPFHGINAYEAQKAASQMISYCQPSSKFSRQHTIEIFSHTMTYESDEIFDNKLLPFIASFSLHEMLFFLQSASSYYLKNYTSGNLQPEIGRCLIRILNIGLPTPLPIPPRSLSSHDILGESLSRIDPQEYLLSVLKIFIIFNCRSEHLIFKDGSIDPGIIGFADTICWIIKKSVRLPSFTISKALHFELIFNIFKSSLVALKISSLHYLPLSPKLYTFDQTWTLTCVSSLSCYLPVVFFPMSCPSPDEIPHDDLYGFSSTIRTFNQEQQSSLLYKFLISYEKAPSPIQAYYLTWALMSVAEINQPKILKEFSFNNSDSLISFITDYREEIISYLNSLPHKELKKLFPLAQFTTLREGFFYILDNISRSNLQDLMSVGSCSQNKWNMLLNTIAIIPMYQKISPEQSEDYSYLLRDFEFLLTMYSLCHEIIKYEFPVHLIRTEDLYRIIYSMIGCEKKDLQKCFILECFNELSKNNQNAIYLKNYIGTLQTFFPDLLESIKSSLKQQIVYNQDQVLFYTILFDIHFIVSV